MVTILNHTLGVDREVRNKSDHYVPLDNLPFGEENIRMQDEEDKLDQLIDDAEHALDKIERGVCQISEVQRIQQRLQDHVSDYQDCFSFSLIKRVMEEAKE